MSSGCGGEFLIMKNNSVDADLISLHEWNSFAEKRMTLLEALTLLNNRYRSNVDKLTSEAYNQGYEDGKVFFYGMTSKDEERIKQTAETL